MKEPCASCPEREKDFGGCRCQAYLLTGDAANADPVCDKSPHHHLVTAAVARAERAVDRGRPAAGSRGAAVPRSPHLHPGGDRDGRRAREDAEAVAVRRVLKMGEPLLRAVAAPGAALRRGAGRAGRRHGRDHARACTGAGIAAPQIGVGARVVIFELKEQPALSAPRPGALHRARQPAADRCSGRSRTRAGRDACRCRACAGWCRASGACATRASMRRGRRIDRTVEGFHARVVQHEVDHLDGILFPQRVRGPAQLRLRGCAGRTDDTDARLSRTARGEPTHEPARHRIIRRQGRARRNRTRRSPARRTSRA